MAKPARRRDGAGCAGDGALEVRRAPHQGDVRRPHATRACMASTRSCTSTPTCFASLSRGCVAPTPSCRLMCRCSGRSRCPRRSTPATAPGGRRYTYIVLEAPVRPALESGRVGWVFRPLDLPAMQAAAAHLLGEHDFSSFRSSMCQSPTPVKHLETSRFGAARCRADLGLLAL